MVTENTEGESSGRPTQNFVRSINLDQLMLVSEMENIKRLTIKSTGDKTIQWNPTIATSVLDTVHTDE